MFILLLNHLTTSIAEIEIYLSKSGRIRNSIPKYSGKFKTLYDDVLKSMVKKRKGKRSTRGDPVDVDADAESGNDGGDLNPNDPAKRPTFEPSKEMANLALLGLVTGLCHTAVSRSRVTRVRVRVWDFVPLPTPRPVTAGKGYNGGSGRLPAGLD
jgi:hypothetical protein